jgi:hypothetical protein
MVDRLHVNHYGQLLMGIIASRYFGLPDPLIPKDISNDIQTFLNRMKIYYSGLELK